MQKHLVWSIYTRIFHWSLMICFFVPYLTEDFYHKSFGVAFFVLAFWRIIFGFSNIRYTKFSDFTFNGLKQYMKNAMQSIKTKNKFDEKSKVDGGHNVASSFAIIFMLIGGMLVAFLGFVMFSAKKKLAIASIFSDSFVSVAKTLHPPLASVVAIVIFIHIAGVLTEKYRGGDALNSMINGKKKEAKFDVEISVFWKIFAILGYIVAILVFIYVAQRG